MKKTVLCAAFLLLLPSLTFAGTMFVTDRIEASVRSGKGLAAGSQYLGAVRTGEKVDVLGIEGEYARVAVENGKVGWLHTRYLTDVQPADNEKLKERIKGLQDELAKGQEEKAGLENFRDQQAVKLKEAEAAYESLKAGCADFVKAREETEKAKKELQANSEVIAQLKRENEDLTQNTQLIWFITGSAAVLCGFLIGMWLQGVRKKRKSKFSF